MRRRPWFIILMVVAFSLIFGVFVFIRFMNESQWLREKIIQNTQTLPGTLEIGKVHSRPDAVTLHNISYTLPDSSLRIFISEVTVNLNIPLARIGGAEIISFVRSIVVEEAEINLKLHKLGKDEGMKVEQDYNLQPIVDRLANLENIVLKNSEIVLSNETNTELFRMNSVEAWIDRYSSSDIGYSVRASLSKERRQSLSIIGRLDLRSNKFKGDMDVRDFPLASLSFPSFIPVSLGNGTLNLEIDFEYTDHLSLLEGSMGIADGSLLISDEVEISEINLSTDITIDSVLIAGECLFEGDEASIRAGLNLKDEARFHADVAIPQGHLGNHLVKFARLAEKDAPIGTIDVTATFDWNLETNNWEAIGYAVSDRLGTPVGNFENIEAKLAWTREKSYLQFIELTSKWNSIDVDAAGIWNPFQKLRFDVVSHLDGQFENTSFPDWTDFLHDKMADGEIRFTYVLRRGWLVEGEGIINSIQSPIPARFSGQLTRDSYVVEVFPQYSDSQQVSVEFGQKGKNPIYFLSEQPLQFIEWSNPGINIPDRLKSLKTTLRGNYKEKTVTGELTSIHPERGIALNLFGSLLMNPNDEMIVVTSYNINVADDPLGNGSLEFSLHENVLDINLLSFKDNLSLDGIYDLNNKKFHEVHLILDELSMEDVFIKSRLLPIKKMDAKLNGRLSLEGDYDHPTISANFDLYDGFFQELSGYWGHLGISTSDDGIVQIENGAFGREESVLLDITGNYALDSKLLDVEIDYERSDANILGEALLGIKNLISGKISIEASIAGNITKPDFELSVQGTNSMIAGIHFDKINLDLEVSPQNDELYSVVLRDVFLDEKNHYFLAASGTAPIKKGYGEINLNLSGNLFELLPQASSFFSDPDGTGNIDWVFAINDGEVRSKSGSINIKDGRVQFKDVLPIVENLFVDIKIDDNGEIQINQLNGIIGRDAAVEISNTHNFADLSSDETIEPILIPYVNLNLGALLFRNVTERGFQFRVPGIMRNAEFGRLVLSGNEGRDWFVVSGPSDSLLFQGKSRISKTEVTYPPVYRNGGNSGAEKHNTFFEELFKKARWDASVLVEEDVQYFRDIKGLDNAGLLQTFSGVFDQILVDVDIEPMDPERPMMVIGRVENESFRLIGELVSTRGSIEFLDLLFQMERAELTFDPTSTLPIASGRAVAQITDDNNNFPRDIYLTLYVLDPETGQKSTRGRWGDFTLELEDELGSSPEEILATLGYSLEGLQEKITSISGKMVSQAVTRRWLRPVERDMARWLGLDLIRLNPTIAQNLLNEQIISPEEYTPDPEENFASRYLQASTLTVGKYLSNDVYLSYTGQLGREDYYGYSSQGKRLGLIQVWKLEYRLRSITPGLILEAGYEYDNLEERRNISTKLRYTILF
ncbi:translocation/assembly module TamB [bacterium]|nr:translocation/assembly module TamB [bacterium]